jgi:hypothetical protein
MNEEIRLSIGVPSSGFVRAGFAHSLANMMGHLASIGIQSRPNTPLTLLLNMVEGSVIHMARENIVMRALEENATHLLFLDDDMVFEADILDVLFSRDSQATITNYLLKVDQPKFLTVDEDSQEIKTIEESTGLQVARSGGFGISLFDMDVFKKTPQPWFLPLYIPSIKRYTTEDVPFFHRIKQAGFQLYVDHDASKKVSHIGNKIWDWKQLSKDR